MGMTTGVVILTDFPSDRPTQEGLGLSSKENPPWEVNFECCCCVGGGEEVDKRYEVRQDRAKDVVPS